MKEKGVRQFEHADAGAAAVVFRVMKHSREFEDLVNDAKSRVREVTVEQAIGGPL